MNNNKINNYDIINYCCGSGRDRPFKMAAEQTDTAVREQKPWPNTKDDYELQEVIGNLTYSNTEFGVV